MLDIVTVADFTDSTRPGHVMSLGGTGFAARTLLLLGSWMENGGASRNWPFHLVCIGEPPACVRELAARCNAQVSVVDRWHNPETTRCPGLNKMRGFEVKGKTDRIFLIDVDTIVYNDLSPLAELPRCVSASQTASNILPEDAWKRMCEGLGRPMTKRRLMSLHAQIGLPGDGPTPPDFVKQLGPLYEPAPPMYSSGALLAPWDCKFGDLWDKNITGIAASCANEEPRERWAYYLSSDQGGFALAIDELRDRGEMFRLLPVGINTLAWHMFRGETTYEELRLYHAVSLYRATGEKFSSTEALNTFEEKRTHPLITGPNPRMDGWKKLMARMRELNDRYVKPALG